MVKLHCAICGKEIKEGEYAIQVSDLVSLNADEGYICENPKCALEWLEQECEVIEVTKEWLKEEIEPYVSEEKDD